MAKIQCLWKVCESQTALGGLKVREREMTRVTRFLKNVDLFEPLERTV